MTSTDIIENFIRLEGVIKREIELEKSSGKIIMLEGFLKNIHSMHECIRKISRCEMLEASG